LRDRAYPMLKGVADELQTVLCQDLPAGPGKQPVIRVFATWPTQWDADYSLPCRGGFFVSSSIQKGQIEFIEIQSTLGGQCRARNPWGENKITLNRNGTQSVNRSGSLLTFETKKGKILFWFLSAQTQSNSSDLY
jgi:alpha-L-fucosidase 2